MSLKCDLGLHIFCGVDVVKRGYELHLQLTWRRGNPCLLFSHRALQEVVSRCLQTAENFFYLKPNALHLKLSWEKKVNINTILVKKLPHILHEPQMWAWSVHISSSNIHSLPRSPHLLVI